MKRLVILLGLALVIGSIGLTAFTSTSANAQGCAGNRQRSCAATHNDCTTSMQEMATVKPAGTVSQQNSCNCDQVTSIFGGSSYQGGFFGQFFQQCNPPCEALGVQPAQSQCCDQTDVNTSTPSAVRATPAC